jgi:hypothetical protein
MRKHRGRRITSVKTDGRAESEQHYLYFFSTNVCP